MATRRRGRRLVLRRESGHGRRKCARLLGRGTSKRERVVGWAESDLYNTPVRWNIRVTGASMHGNSIDNDSIVDFIIFLFESSFISCQKS